MDSYYNYLSQTDKNTVASFKKKSLVELKNMRKEIRSKKDMLLIRRYSPEIGRKINYLANREGLIDYVINKYKK